MSSLTKDRHISVVGKGLATPGLGRTGAARPVANDYECDSIRPHRLSPADRADLVLVVCADALECAQLANALANQGCKTLVAADGETALAMAKSRQPSLIVLEISLPGWDGFRICAGLRNDELLRHIPVILLSHKLEPEEKMRGLRLGAVDYITDPFDWTEVAAQVLSQLKLERLRRDLKVANFDLMAKQAQHQADLKAAADIQRSLLPAHKTENFGDVGVAWRFMPLDHVGGDLLGYTWLDEDTLAAYVVDVCGHGLPAAMVTAAVSISLAPSIISGGRKTSAAHGTPVSPKEILESLDREYPFERFNRPFTISYLALNRKTGEFRCSRAGHPLPIVIRSSGELESIEAGGTIIGLDQMLPFDEGVGRLNRGDSILLYSDGVTECVGESGIFGLEGLIKVLRQSSGGSPESICDRIVKELLRFKGGAVMHDDVTMLALTYNGGLQHIADNDRFACMAKPA